MLIPWLYSKADAIVTVNHGIAHELRTFYGLEKSNILTIGNFYNISEIEQLSKEPKMPAWMRLYRDTVLITTGRLAPEKGLHSIVRIFQQLKLEFPNLRLVMVGDGPEYGELKNLCEELNLTLQTELDINSIPDVVLIGSQNNVFKYLKEATLYIMNSSSEGFPNGLAEALICGVPVVTSDCPYGPREILAPEFPFSVPVSKPYISQNGVLMPMIRTSEDIVSWTETLIDIIKKKDLLMSLAENGKKRINLFDQELIVSQWHAVLR